MEYKTDKSGINSLAGFAYQIRVFAYYAFDLKNNMQIEFETIDDVNLKTINPTQIDKYSHKFLCKSNNSGTNIAIQVKHTSISKDVAQQMLLNWILLERSDYQVERYILFSDKIYNNSSEIFTDDVKEIYNTIIRSNKKNNATITKVKKIYINAYDAFEKIYNIIKDKFEFIDLSNINDEIEKKASLHFRKASNLIVFRQRLNEFLQYITVQIMDSVLTKKTYALNYLEFIRLIEDISQRFTQEITIPCYSDFKRVNIINLNNSQISKSREYEQLCACELPENLIKQHLMYSMYYHATSLKYMENNRIQKINDIEETTFENFEMVKFNLQKSHADTPYNRLEETKKSPNSYADNEQIKYGSSIYLTKDNIGKRQISWKDDHNE